MEVPGGTWGPDQPLAQHRASLFTLVSHGQGDALKKQQGSRLRPLINTKSQFILFYILFFEALSSSFCTGNLLKMMEGGGGRGGGSPAAPG